VSACAPVALLRVGDDFQGTLAESQSSMCSRSSSNDHPKNSPSAPWNRASKALAPAFPAAAYVGADDEPELEEPLVANLQQEAGAEVVLKTLRTGSGCPRSPLGRRAWCPLPRKRDSCSGRRFPALRQTQGPGACTLRASTPVEAEEFADGLAALALERIHGVAAAAEAGRREPRIRSKRGVRRSDR